VTKWTSDELATLDSTDELRIESARGDGTLRDPVTIWVVRLGDEAYVRSVRGRSSSWFRGAQDRHEARITVDGVGRTVETDELADEIDAAYRAKYERYAATIVNSVLSPEARSATFKLVPQPS
jgi:hypothetical protein